MQNKYAGDVGDFGKLGMLRCIEKSGISVGINWYLVEDESHNNDGKHIGYLENKKYCGCDDELLKMLGNMLEQNNRSVLELEKMELLKTQKYYHERLCEPKQQENVNRLEWHQGGLNSMRGCELVFLDPDNGLLPKSVGRGSNKSIKYVFPEEIIDYYKEGHSVVFYSHRTRESLDVYLKRFVTLFGSKEFENATIKGISFRRGTTRDYFFILQEEHISRIENALAELFGGKWSEHFSGIQISDASEILQ